MSKSQERKQIIPRRKHKQQRVLFTIHSFLIIPQNQNYEPTKTIAALVIIWW